MPKINRNGVNLHYDVSTGTGPPILFVHGFPLNSTLWDPQVAAFGDTYRCVTPDLMGFGHSDAPGDPSLYSTDSFAYDLVAALDDADIDRAVVCGLSMGGYATFALLRRAPERVAGLVLADTRAEADPQEAVQARTQQQERIRSEGTGFLVDTMLSGPLVSEHTREHKQDVVEAARKVMDNPEAGFLGALQAMKDRVDSTELLPKIDLPTLIVVGEHDAITPPEVARDMHSRIGGSQLVVIPDAGHLSNLESPSDFNGAVAGFLKGL